MSGSSQKHRNSVARRMSDIPVTELGGVDENRVIVFANLPRSSDVSLNISGISSKKQNSGKMSRTSEKHRNFVAEPMGDKSVTELAGVGEVLGKRLAAAGFSKAQNVLGQHLILKKDPEAFKGWMKDVCQANSKQAADAHQCLDEWSKEFV